MASTIPVFKAALVTRLQADSSLTTEAVQISYGHPHPKRMRKDVVIIGNVRTADQSPAGLGSTSMNETYIVEVIVSCVGPAQESQQSLETRAFLLAGYLEASIITWRTTNPPFGSNSILQALTKGMTSLEGLSDQGDTREASVTVNIEVEARI